MIIFRIEFLVNFTWTRYKTVVRLYIICNIFYTYKVAEPPAVVYDTTGRNSARDVRLYT